MDFWEYDLFDVHGLSKYNDGVKFLLSVIEVFSKNLHVVPLKSKTGPSVTSAFQLVLHDSKYSNRIRKRPLVVQTDGGK